MLNRYSNMPYAYMFNTSMKGSSVTLQDSKANPALTGSVQNENLEQFNKNMYTCKNTADELVRQHISDSVQWIRFAAYSSAGIASSQNGRQSRNTMISDFTWNILDL